MDTAHPDEIPLVIGCLVQRYSKLLQRNGLTLAPESMERLLRRRLLGAVRALENPMKRMIVVGLDGNSERKVEH